MGYSLNSLENECYKGTTCLINKMNITDEDTLNKIEADITFAKSSQLEECPISGNFDFEHYKAIHKFLFEDLYSWAGEIRKVNLYKKGTAFTDFNKIEDVADRIFLRLKAENFFRECSDDEFVNNIVDFYCMTNMLHPFREGNGRTQRIFIAQLVRFCGYDINFSDIDPDELIIGTINSANGVTDLLKEIFRNNIKKQDCFT